jgi:hypothetical protein
VPKHRLKIVGRSNPVSIQKDVKEVRRKRIEQLHCRIAGLASTVADKHSPLSP